MMKPLIVALALLFAGHAWAGAGDLRLPGDVLHRDRRAAAVLDSGGVPGHTRER